MTSLWMYAAVILAFLIFLAIIRLAKGPEISDRAVAFDTINTLTVALMIMLGVAFKEMFFVEIAIVYAVLSFVGTLFIARYIGGEF